MFNNKKALLAVILTFSGKYNIQKLLNEFRTDGVMLDSRLESDIPDGHLICEKCGNQGKSKYSAGDLSITLDTVAKKAAVEKVVGAHVP